MAELAGLYLPILEEDSIKKATVWWLLFFYVAINERARNSCRRVCQREQSHLR